MDTLEIPDYEIPERRKAVLINLPVASKNCRLKLSFETGFGRTMKQRTAIIEQLATIRDDIGAVAQDVLTSDGCPEDIAGVVKEILPDGIKAMVYHVAAVEIPADIQRQVDKEIAEGKRKKEYEEE